MTCRALRDGSYNGFVKRKPTFHDFQPALSLDGRRVSVDPDTRRIAVRVANYGEVHSGFGPEVKVPRNANLDAAHVGVADLADGSSLRVAVLPMDVKHAPPDLQALHAASWYENSGMGIARGRYSVDEQGVRFDGILFDDVEDSKIDRLTAGSASGDWRSAIALKSFGDFEHAPADFVGSCIVNIPGYSDTFRQAPAERFALVASAAGDLISIEDGTVEDDRKPEGTEEAKPAEAPALDAKPDPAPADEPTVTLKASAVKHLLDVAAADGADDVHGEAIEEARTALIAGGFMHAPDSVEARVAKLEAELVIEREFNRPD